MDSCGNFRSRLVCKAYSPLALNTHRHPFCECAPGFGGPHCEYLATVDEQPQSRTKGKIAANHSETSGGGIVALCVLLAGILLLACLFAARQMRRIRRRRRERMAQRVARINLQGFRDGGEDRNDEFAVPVSTLNHRRVIPSYPSSRTVKRKNSDETRRISTLNLTPSIGLQRKQSIVRKPSLRREPSTSERGVGRWNSFKLGPVAEDVPDAVARRPRVQRSDSFERLTFNSTKDDEDDVDSWNPFELGASWRENNNHDSDEDSSSVKPNISFV